MSDRKATGGRDPSVEGAHVAYLRSQFVRARPALFTGAGFSLAALDLAGNSIPSVGKLHEELWRICFPDNEFDPGSSFPYLVDSALIRHPRQLGELLTRRLSVDAETLPEWYRPYFAMPWHRAYTLNIDDIESAAARKFRLDRRVVTVSATATTPQRPAGSDLPLDLEFVHLNGTIQDIPDAITFSVTQYAQRLASNEPWYVRLVGDLATRPFVFVGSQLDESPLWQHLAMREHRGIRGLRERRPKSFLVTPHLDIARQALLTDYNIVHLPMTAQEFGEEVLGKLNAASATGQTFIQQEATRPTGGRGQLKRVAELIGDQQPRTEYLMGAEPSWADVLGDRAVERTIDRQALETVRQLIDKPTPTVVVLTGTAASGKSTTLMRIAATLNAGGVEVAWVDQDTELLPREIDEAMRIPGSPRVLAIDDADLLGGDLSPIAGAVARGPESPIVLVAIRAGKVDQYIVPGRLGDVTVIEISMPNLADEDIDGLIRVLDRENRLGVLKGMSTPRRRAVFKDLANRQLVVAMIQATSGRRFEEKIVKELEELPARQRALYSIVATATALRYSMRRDEVLIALNEATNEAVNDLDALVRRGVLVPGSDGRTIRARHRQIADLIVAELGRRGELLPVLEGLIVVAATRVSPQLHRSARPWRFLKALINHEYLMAVLRVEPARNLYGSVEEILHWDYHYWLQRGSLEAQAGDLGLAENFLGQARALAPSDPLVQTEWAYFLFKRAISNPTSGSARQMVTEAIATLQDLIENRGINDPYPYHVLCTQSLNWARTALSAREAKTTFLRETLAVAEEAVRRHPNRPEMEVVRADVQRALLTLAVAPGKDDQDEPPELR